MIKYFINLAKIKECAALYKNKPVIRKVLIAGIGTENEIFYTMFLGTNKTKPGFCIEIENKIEREDTIELDTDDWISKIKETAEYYNEGMDEEPTYYCTNPSCTEFGEVLVPVKDDKGRMVCPVCNGYLTKEEPKCEISYNRLIEIALSLLIYSTSGDEQIGYELCEYLDIGEDEYDMLMANYDEEAVS